MSDVRRLEVVHGTVDDLEPLSRSRIEELKLIDLDMLSDLSPLTTTRLRSLILRDLPELSDLTPLADLPLEECRIDDCPKITNLSPLNQPRLRRQRASTNLRRHPDNLPGDQGLASR
jgi:hypothetical protein